MESNKELMNDISENVRKYQESKKKRKKIDFSRYSTARLKEEIVKYENDPSIFLTIFYILKSRQSPVVMCNEARMQLERERIMSVVPVHFGKKDESYQTEEEMLSGFKCTFDDLSTQEKQIYNNQVKSCRI